MGTRHLTCVCVNGEYRIAQYGQWDGYPDGQGLTALKFVRDQMDRSDFKRKVLATTEVSQEERSRRYAEVGHDGSEWVSMDISNKFKERWPHLNRDMGAEILQYIQDQPEGLGIQRQLEFAADSLFCEWAWVIDLDKGTFEAFKGFNKEPLAEGERFGFLKPDNPEYYPVKKAAAWFLDALPTDEEFLAAFKDDEDE
jgi:hypothetical protein